MLLPVCSGPEFTESGYGSRRFLDPNPDSGCAESAPNPDPDTYPETNHGFNKELQEKFTVD